LADLLSEAHRSAERLSEADPSADPSADPLNEARLAQEMRAEWNARARENAEYYVQSAERGWDRRKFFRSGEISVANEVMPDMLRICGGSRSPFGLRMLEIGCGVGRMTRTLSRIFGHVTALDISDEMLAQAEKNLAGLKNVSLVLGDGVSLAPIPSESLDFAFSFIVFQHIPSLDAIRSYCQEAYRVLRPGSLFKFQVQGYEGGGGGVAPTNPGLVSRFRWSRRTAWPRIRAFPWNPTMAKAPSTSGCGFASLAVSRIPVRGAESLSALSSAPCIGASRLTERLPSRRYNWFLAPWRGRYGTTVERSTDAGCVDIDNTGWL
jgi:SAM-dependent methyltransferase